MTDASGKYEISKVRDAQNKDGQRLITFAFHPHEDLSDIVNAPPGTAYLATFEPADYGT